MSTFFAEEPDWYRGESFGQPTAIEPTRADNGSLRVAVALIERDDDTRDRLTELVGSNISTFASLDELRTAWTATLPAALGA